MPEARYCKIYLDLEDYIMFYLSIYSIQYDFLNEFVTPNKFTVPIRRSW